jgi:Raf kinase inhibitor-like YbhB/YbcL family protein
MSNRFVVTAMVLALGSARGFAQNPTPIAVSSSAIQANQPIPRDYTADGRNVSPPLTWSGIPASARELAVILEDPDAGSPPPYVHWLIYKIPVAAAGLPEDIPIDPSTPMPAAIRGALQGANGFRRNIYRGPAPPPGRAHHYRFVVYAIDRTLDAPAGLTRQQLLDLMAGHIGGQGELVATYERTAPAGSGEAPAGRGRGRGPGQ